MTARYVFKRFYTIPIVNDAFILLCLSACVVAVKLDDVCMSQRAKVLVLDQFWTGLGRTEKPLRIRNGNFARDLECRLNSTATFMRWV